MFWQGDWGHIGQRIARGEPWAFVEAFLVLAAIVVLYKLISWWRLR
jgi:hypothetical protein